jgi:hypothetical protein
MPPLLVQHVNVNISHALKAGFPWPLSRNRAGHARVGVERAGGDWALSGREWRRMHGWLGRSTEKYLPAFRHLIA